MITSYRKGELQGLMQHQLFWEHILVLLMVHWDNSCHQYVFSPAFAWIFPMKPDRIFGSQNFPAGQPFIIVRASSDQQGCDGYSPVGRTFCRAVSVPVYILLHCSLVARYQDRVLLCGFFHQPKVCSMLLFSQNIYAFLKNTSQDFGET